MNKNFLIGKRWDITSSIIIYTLLPHAFDQVEVNAEKKLTSLKLC